MKDEEQFVIERKKHRELLKKKNIKSKKVLDAFMNVPRELFVAKEMAISAYSDHALPIACGQTISQPFTVIFMTELLDLKQSDRVLEIGSGSGYQTAILAQLAREVYSIERIQYLHKAAAELLNKLNIKAHLFCNDGTIGLPEFSPYDAIIVTAAAPSVPEMLKEQLKIGGKLVIPVGTRESQEMQLIERIGENEFTTSYKGAFRFVPLVGKDGWNEKY